MIDLPKLLTPEQLEIARKNATYQEMGISLEERVIALEEFVLEIIGKDKSIVASKFKDIHEGVKS